MTAVFYVVAVPSPGHSFFEISGLMTLVVCPTDYEKDLTGIVAFLSLRDLSSPPDEDSWCAAVRSFGSDFLVPPMASLACRIFFLRILSS